MISSARPPARSCSPAGCLLTRLTCAPMARSILVIAERAEATMTDQVEIEQKFDVDEGFERPDFGALADGVAAADPVVYHLAATYFDTAGERLAANKITLRRRTGGSDEGWHLKLPRAD